MCMARVLRKAKLALLATCLMLGSTVCSCGLVDIKDNIIAGALAAVKAAATDAVDSVLPNFNEFIDAIPDAAVVPTP